VTRPPSQAVIEAVEQAMCRLVHGEDWTVPVALPDSSDPRNRVAACYSCQRNGLEVARAAEQAADEKWMRWLIEQLHYGIDTSCEVDPPCTLADYAAMWERIDPREKHMAEVIVAETGAWADELTDTDDRPPRP
jgi:hypothetical protein